MPKHCNKSRAQVQEEAASLISARPFSPTDDFLTKLNQYIAADELEIAKTYLGGN